MNAMDKLANQALMKNVGMKNGAMEKVNANVENANVMIIILEKIAHVVWMIAQAKRRRVNFKSAVVMEYAILALKILFLDVHAVMNGARIMEEMTVHVQVKSNQI